MSKNSTIVLFYSGIAVLCGLLIFGFSMLGKKWDRDRKAAYKEEQKAKQEKINADNAKAYKEAFLKGMAKYGMREDLKGIDQSGAEINLKESFKGKVVVFAQYYGNCPSCMSVNFKVLERIREKFKDVKDLQIVTVGVKEQAKPDLEHLKSFADHYDKGLNKWSFIYTDVPAFDTWANKNLGYANIRINEGAEAAKEPINHDMGICVLSRQGVMINKEDIYSATNIEGSDKIYADGIEAQLFDSIEFALKQK